MKISAFTLFCMLILVAASAGYPADFPKGEMDVEIGGTFGKIPLHFIENRGQMDEVVAYYGRGADKTVYFTPSGVTFSLRDEREDGTGRWTVKLDFQSAKKAAKIRGEARRDGVVSYFKGNPDAWKKGIPTYARLVYRDLWPGIDLVFRCEGNRLKYEFRVKAGADPKNIRLAYCGVSHVSVNKGGGLEVSTPAGGFEDGVPRAYQLDGSERKEVPVRYSIERNDVEKVFFYGFDVGAFDTGEPLVIDPELLVYCGYLGGEDQDGGSDIALDDEGNAYVVGYSRSDELSFPIKVGPDLSHNALDDGFVAKVNADGTDLVYCGYIGGAEGDGVRSVAVDGQGNAYVVGITTSDEKTFPVKGGPDLSYNGTGEVDAFVAKVNAQGTDLEFCGYIGGSDVDFGMGIAVDGAGDAYITGSTRSDATSFPVTVGPYLTNMGIHDAFVAKLDAKGTHFDYCGFIGGDLVEWGNDIDVDGAGNAYVVGYTSSQSSSFPVKKGPDLSHNGMVDVFVAKVNPQGTDLDYCGYIGGADYEYGFGIAVDAESKAYVTGYTCSHQTSFPVKNGPDLSFNALDDAFVAKVNSQGTDLDYCGYIGGRGQDYCDSIAVDDDGRAYVAGWTWSDESNFPVRLGPDLSFNGKSDAFVARVNAQGTGLNYCGYIGGDSPDALHGIAVDSQRRAYVTGQTRSKESSFPVKVGPDLTHNGPGWDEIDAFVAKVADISLVADAYELSEAAGGTIHITLDAGLKNANRDYILLGSTSGADPGFQLPGGKAVMPLNWDLFTSLTVSALNSHNFSNFLGKTDASGRSAAEFRTRGPLPPGSAGTVIHFAYALAGPWDFASNPVPVEIVP